MVGLYKFSSRQLIVKPNQMEMMVIIGSHLASSKNFSSGLNANCLCTAN